MVYFLQQVLNLELGLTMVGRSQYLYQLRFSMVKQI